MTRVVVVTRNPAVSIGLQRHGYDVSDVRPDKYGEWTASAGDAEAVVLELSDPLAAESAVQRLRAEGRGVPVLLVSNSAPGWETTAAHAGPGTRVLPLPISLPALLGALEELVEAGPIEVEPAAPVEEPVAEAPAEPPANEEELLSAVAASIGMSISESGTLVAEGAAGDPVPDAVPDGDPAPDAVPDGDPVPDAVPDGDPVPDAVPDGDPAPVPEPAPVPLPEPEPVPLPEPEPGPVPEREPVPEAPAPSGAEALVAALTPRAHELSTVADCAEVAVDELLDRVGAEATACLLPDGDEWRVAGGRGLRPLEERVRLPADHWLVTTVAGGERAVLVDGTDVAREQLHGAPLASWRHLLAVPVPEVRGLLVAARESEPFEERALEVAVAVAREAAPLLVDAVAARALARALLPYADLGGA